MGTDWFFSLLKRHISLLSATGCYLIAHVVGSWGPKRYPNIAAHLSEQPPAQFREVAVTRDARGHYYCSFVYEEAEQNRHHHNGVVAFDLGIKTLATGYTDTGRFYHIRRL